MAARSPDVKVKLESPDGDVETLWATSMGEDRYRLDNSPFFAYSVSWLDIVEAHLDEIGQLSMTRVVEKSGHRTVRVVLEAPAASSALLDQLNAIGCTYEGANQRYFSVDIPPGVHLDQVTALLIQSGEQWEHGDPSYAELYPDETAAQ
jgi:hypothetical protein